MTIPPNPHPEQVEAPGWLVKRALAVIERLAKWDGSCSIPGDMREVQSIAASLANRPADDGEPVAWCSPGQLANLTEVDADGGVYLPIRKTKRGNFIMPLYGAPPQPEGVKRP